MPSSQFTNSSSSQSEVTVRIISMRVLLLHCRHKLYCLWSTQLCDESLWAMQVLVFWLENMVIKEFKMLISNNWDNAPYFKSMKNIENLYELCFELIDLTIDNIFRSGDFMRMLAEKKSPRLRPILSRKTKCTTKIVLKNL